MDRSRFNITLNTMYRSYHNIGAKSMGKAMVIRWSRFCTVCHMTFASIHRGELYIDTVEPLLSDPPLSKFSVIQPQTHSPNSI